MATNRSHYSTKPWLTSPGFALGLTFFFFSTPAGKWHLRIAEQGPACVPARPIVQGLPNSLNRCLLTTIPTSPGSVANDQD